MSSDNKRYGSRFGRPSGKGFDNLGFDPDANPLRGGSYAEPDSGAQVYTPEAAHTSDSSIDQGRFDASQLDPGHFDQGQFDRGQTRADDKAGLGARIGSALSFSRASEAERQQDAELDILSDAGTYQSGGDDYASQGYEEQAYSDQSYVEPGYDQGAYAGDSYDQGSYAQGYDDAYADPAVATASSGAQSGRSARSSGGSGWRARFAAETSSADPYAAGNEYAAYDQDSYGQGGYDQGSYGQDSYAQQGYDQGSYDQAGYEQDGYQSYDTSSYGSDSYATSAPAEQPQASSGGGSRFGRFSSYFGSNRGGADEGAEQSYDYDQQGYNQAQAGYGQDGYGQPGYGQGGYNDGEFRPAGSIDDTQIGGGYGSDPGLSPGGAEAPPARARGGFSLSSLLGSKWLIPGLAGLALLAIVVFGAMMFLGGGNTYEDPQVVTSVERMLVAFGSDPGAQDGVIDDDYKMAVREMQRMFDLPETGQVDETLYKHLTDMLALINGG